MFDLPDHAQAILARLIDEDAETAAAARARSAEIREIKLEFASAESEVARLLPWEERGKLYREKSGGRDSAGHEIIEREPDPVLDNARARLRQLEARLARKQSVAVVPRMGGARAKALLAKLDPSAEFDDGRVTVKPTRNESPEEAVARLDAAIPAAVANRKKIAGASRTAAELKASFSARVRSLRVSGAPRVLPAVEGGSVQLPTVQLPTATGAAFQFATDAAGLVFWLFGDELEKRVGALIDANTDPANALSAAEKAKRLAAADERLLELHRERAAWVELIVGKGGKAHHRPDAPVEAVLGITVA